MGALCAWRGLSDHTALRQLLGRAQVGIRSQSEFLSSPELLCRRTDFLRAMARRRRGRPPRAAVKSARPVLGAVLWLRLPRPVPPAALPLSDTGGARCRTPARRFTRRPPRPPPL